jgi:hypothetical protein
MTNDHSDKSYLIPRWTHEISTVRCTGCPKCLETMVHCMCICLIACRICAARVHPILHARSEPVYHVSSDYFQHIGINSNVSLGNSLPKMTNISDFHSIHLLPSGIPKKQSPAGWGQVIVVPTPLVITSQSIGQEIRRPANHALELRNVVGGGASSCLNHWGRPPISWRSGIIWLPNMPRYFHPLLFRRRKVDDTCVP